MRLGVVVLAHRNPKQLACLVGALTDPSVDVYLHIDSAASLAPFQQALSSVHTGNLVFLPRFRSRWGGMEVVDATLAGLARAVAAGCDYVVLVSGQDIPLWPVEQILNFYADTPRRSALAYFPLPDPRWRSGGLDRINCYTFSVLGRRETCLPRGWPIDRNWRGRALNAVLRAWSVWRPPRRFPDSARPFGGSQWWNLSRAAAGYVLQFVQENPAYRAYHRHTLLPDEIFFQSILLGTSFCEHHEVQNDSLRFMIWNEGASHPRDLTVHDLPAMRASGLPFARKADGESGCEIASALGLPSTGTGIDP